MKSRKKPRVPRHAQVSRLEHLQLSRSPAYQQLEDRRLLSISEQTIVSTPLTTFDTGDAALIAGLQDVGKWAGQVDNNGALAAQVPIAGESLGQALNLQNILGAQFAAGVVNYLQTTPSATAEELATFLSNFSVTAGGLTVNVKQGTNGTNGAVASFDSTTDDLLITLDLTASGTSSVSLDLASGLGSSPIGFDQSVAGTLNTSFDFKFSFGLNLNSYVNIQAAQQPPGGSSSPPPPPQPQFVLNANGNAISADADFTPGAGGIVDANGNPITGNVGVLGVTLASAGTVAVDNDFSLALPGGDLPAGDFASPSMGGGLTVTSTGDLAASLPLTAQVGGTTFNSNDALTIASTPLFTPATPGTLATPTYAVTGADATEISSFENVTAGDVQNALVQLGGWAAGLSSSAAFATPVPFTSTKLGDVANLETAYDQALAKVLPGPSQVSITTLEDLVGQLPKLANGSAPAPTYNPATNQLTLPIHVFSSNLPAVTTPLSFTSAGDLTGFTTTDTLTLTPQAGLDFTLGIDLSKLGADSPNKLAEPIDPAGVTLADLNGGKGVAFNVGLTAAQPFANPEGQLAADATFSLTVAGATGSPLTEQITIAAADTTSNNSLDDLIPQITSAIMGTLANTPFAGEIQAENDNGTIVLAAAATPTAGSTPVTSISIAGGAALGFAATQATSLTDADLTITTHDGNTYPVSLRGLGESATLAQVFAAIQAQTNGDVTGSVYENAGNAYDALNGRAIALTDTSSGTGQFTISAANGSVAGAAGYGLGIIGTEGLNGTIVSGPLDGDSPANHVYAQNVSASISLAPSQQTVNGTADLGIIPISVQGATLTIGTDAAPITATVTLADPNSVGVPQFSGTASLSLPAAVSSPLLAGANISGTLAVDWPTGAAATLAALDSTTALGQLAGLTDSDVLTAFGDASGFLADAAQTPALSGNLPPVGQSLDSLAWKWKCDRRTTVAYPAAYDAARLAYDVAFSAV